MTSPARGTAITTIAVLNNDISGTLFSMDMIARGIPFSEVAVLLIRELRQPWLEQCGAVIRYGGRASHTLVGQRRFIGFYRNAAALIRRVTRSGTLHHVYIVNNDNLLSSHLLESARGDAKIDVTVVGEGLMNFQDISVKNRAAWRWKVKPILAGLLGLRYRAPEGHLSGADDPAVGRVLSFARASLKAPAEKVVIYPFPPIQPSRAADHSIALIAHTSLWQWMSDERYRPFAEAFAAWVKRQGFTKIYAKPHPRYETGYLQELLPEHEILTTPQSLEEIAGDLEAGTILGTCCTALVTLKMIRPDLRCIDYGGDYYVRHAYHGDRSVLDLFEDVGIETARYDGAGAA